MDLRIISLGNVLMGDDGLGPYVLRTIESEFVFPPSVTLTDAGTPGLDLTPFLADVDAVIVVDTVNGASAPGTVAVFSRNQLLAHLPQPRLSPHDPGLKEAILTLEFAGRAPTSIVLVGVTPHQTRPGPGLSPVVRDAVPRAVSAVLHEVLRHGIPVTRKRQHAPPDIWWERPPTAEAHARRGVEGLLDDAAAGEEAAVLAEGLPRAM
jgi:hydrogenase maturation protease